MRDNKSHRETGATKYPAKTGADPSDAFGGKREDQAWRWADVPRE